MRFEITYPDGMTETEWQAAKMADPKFLAFVRRVERKHRREEAVRRGVIPAKRTEPWPTSAS
jgi:hypothetical protein